MKNRSILLAGLLFLGSILTPVQALAQFMVPVLLTPPPVAAGGIAYISGSAQNLGSNGGTGNFSGAYTSASGTHVAMVVCINGGTTGASTVTNVTYNGVVMTLAFGAQNPGGGGRYEYEYYLLGPASGANNLVITQTGGDYLIPIVAEYSGVKQTAQPDAIAANSSGGSSVTSLTSSITVMNTGSWAVMCGNASNGSAGWSSGTGATFRAADVFAGSAIYDSAGPLSAGANSLTDNVSLSSALLNILVSLQPG